MQRCYRQGGQGVQGVAAADVDGLVSHVYSASVAAAAAEAGRAAEEARFDVGAA